MPWAWSPPSNSEPELATLIDAAAGGDARATGRLISLVESGGEAARAIAAHVFPRGGRAWVVGVTGAPGAGKSSLVDRLVAARRAAGDRVAVVAVDPTSPFSGGAILGDRVRMQEHAADAGVYVRSMASRGQAGGLSGATLGAVRLLDAVGWPWILVETVGAGQVEVDVAQAADTTVVVLTPGMGDDVQADKAGLLEIGDVFAVNKADRPGADETVRDLEAVLDLGGGDAGWRPPVVRTVATTGLGVDDLGGAIEAHRAHLASGGRLEERRAWRLAGEVRRLVEDAGARATWERCRGPAFDEALADVRARRLDPQAAASRLLREKGPSAVQWRDVNREG